MPTSLGRGLSGVSAFVCRSLQTASSSDPSSCSPSLQKSLYLPSTPITLS